MVKFEIIEGDDDKLRKEAEELYLKCKPYVDQGWGLSNTLAKILDKKRCTLYRGIGKRVKEVFIEKGYVRTYNGFIHKDRVINNLEDLIKRLSSVDKELPVYVRLNNETVHVRDVFFDTEDDKIVISGNELSTRNIGTWKRI